MKRKFVSESLLELHQRLKDVTVIYTDLDNTLLGSRGSIFLIAEKSYTLEPAKSLISLLNQEIDIVPVSGRNNQQLREMVRLLGLNNYIAELGCLVFYNQGREVLKNYPPSLTASEESLHQAIFNLSAPSLLLKHFSGQLEYHTPWSEKQECTHLFRGLVDLAAANTLLEKRGYSNLKLRDNGRIRRKGSLKNISEVHAYHLTPKESSKASAILLDQKKRKISREQTVAIGDSFTDLEMASVVGTFFLVVNKIDEKTLRKVEKYQNLYFTSKKMGLGWAEVADLIISAAKK